MASLSALGRVGSLPETIDEDILGDEFFDCPCDDPEFRFVFKEEHNYSRGSGNRSDGSRKGSSGEAGQQGSEQQQQML